MDVDFIFELIGLFGGIFLGICLMPQVYRTIKTNSTKDISLIWQILYLIGLSLIYTYTILTENIPLVHSVFYRCFTSVKNLN